MALKVFKKASPKAVVVEVAVAAPAPSPKPKKSKILDSITPPDSAVSSNAAAIVTNVEKAHTKGSGKSKEEILTTEHESHGMVKSTLEPLGSINVQMGVTRNLGNYESVKMSVSMTYPTTVANADAAFEAAQKWVDDKVNYLNQQIDDELAGKA